VLGDTLSGKEENKTCESLKWLKGAKLEDLNDASVISMGKMNINMKFWKELIRLRS
jgi:hypothetical protein